MVVLLPKTAMVSDCDGAGIEAVCKERKRRLRHARLHYIQCFQVINIHHSSATNSNSYFLFLLPPPPRLDRNAFSTSTSLVADAPAYELGELTVGRSH